jgi:hypothetical protein
VGFVYPVYESIKTIETEGNKADDTFWLTYWLVFALFKVRKLISSFLLVNGLSSLICRWWKMLLMC